MEWNRDWIIHYSVLQPRVGYFSTTEFGSIVSHLRGLIIVTMGIPTLSLLFLISEYPTNLFPIFFIGFLYMMLILLTSFYINRKIIDPITVLGENAKNIMKGNMSADIDYQSDDEIGQFALIFKQMKDQLLANEQAMQRFEEARKLFIINITHDLKTPLSSIRAYVEGLQEGILMWANPCIGQENQLK